MGIQEILHEVTLLEAEISKIPTGAPELPSIVVRCQSLRAEIDRLRAAQGPLIPDTETPSTATQKTLEELDRALRNLISAARSKQEALPV